MGFPFLSFSADMISGTIKTSRDVLTNGGVVDDPRFPVLESHMPAVPFRMTLCYGDAVVTGHYASVVHAKQAVMFTVLAGEKPSPCALPASALWAVGGMYGFLGIDEVEEAAARTGAQHFGEQAVQTFRKGFGTRVAPTLAWIMGLQDPTLRGFLLEGLGMSCHPDMDAMLEAVISGPVWPPRPSCHVSFAHSCAVAAQNPGGLCVGM